MASLRYSGLRPPTRIMRCGCYAALRMHEASSRYAERRFADRGGTEPIRVGPLRRSCRASIGMELRWTNRGRARQQTSRAAWNSWPPGHNLLSSESVAPRRGLRSGLAARSRCRQGTRVRRSKSTRSTGAGNVHSPRMEAAAVRGLTPFVGRESELRDSLNKGTRNAARWPRPDRSACWRARRRQSRAPFWEFIHSPSGDPRMARTRHGRHGVVQQVQRLSAGLLTFLKSYFQIDAR